MISNQTAKIASRSSWPFVHCVSFNGPLKRRKSHKSQGEMLNEHGGCGIPVKTERSNSPSICWELGARHSPDGDTAL
jgi:hypothetical protein